MEEKKQNTSNTFEYTYSARQQEEIENIRRKYLPRETDKMEELRRLDQSTTKKGTIVSILVGTAGTLIFGVGMCCILVWNDRMFIPGIVIGLIGMAGIGAACPLYGYITRKQREKIAPQILELTEELSGKK